MEGPSPVSALIHAATMVTAGVFLSVRLASVFEQSTVAPTLCSALSSITVMFAACTSLYQNDVKRIIAFSTCSQLGYMIMAVGASHYQIAMGHLFTHAVFKAALFLLAGALIHAFANDQDLRLEGGAAKDLTFSYAGVFVASYALGGLPFLSGFYSKDAVLECAWATHTTAGTCAYICGIVGAFFTAFYSTRLIAAGYSTLVRMFRREAEHTSDAPSQMFSTLVVAVFLSTWIGYATAEKFSPLMPALISNSNGILPRHFDVLDIEHIPLFIKVLPTIISNLGLVVGVFYYYYGAPNRYLVKSKQVFFHFISNKWTIDSVYREELGRPGLKVGTKWLYNKVERGLFERVGPTSLSKVFRKLAGYTSRAFEGDVHKGLSGMLIGTLILFLIALIVK